MHAFTDGHDVVRLLRRTVRNAYAAGQVDECDMHAGLLLHVNRQLEQDACQCRIVLIGNRVGGEECVNAEMLNTLLLHVLERFDQLLAGHAVLRFLGCTDNCIPPRHIRPGIISETDAFRYQVKPFHIIQIGNIIQINNSPKLMRFQKLFIRCVIGRKNNFLSCDSHRFRQNQFCHGTAVCTHAKFF